MPEAKRQSRNALPVSVDQLVDRVMDLLRNDRQRMSEALIHYFLTSDDMPLEVDLKRLGVNCDESSDDLELGKLQEGIRTLREIIDLILSTPPVPPCVRELDFLLQTDVPNKKVRRDLVRILFNGGFYRFATMGLAETFRSLYHLLNPPFLKPQRPVPDNVLVLGKTPDEVAARKKELRIWSPKRGESRGTLIQIDELLQGQALANKPLLLLEDGEDETANKKNYEAFAISVFCLCITKLARLPSSLDWVRQPEKHFLRIPESAERELRLVEMICRTYGFFNYRNHVQEALRAFARVYFGISRQETRETRPPKVISSGPQILQILH